MCVFHYCDQWCECNTSQMLSCVLLGYHALINLFLNGKYTSLPISSLLRNSLKIDSDYWLFQIVMFPRRLNLGHSIIVA